jgi:hypothetical protein
MSFDFINTSGDPKKVSQSNFQTVRRRATQAAALTRQQRRSERARGSSPFHPPPWLVSDWDQAEVESSSHSKYQAMDESTHTWSSKWHTVIPFPDLALSTSPGGSLRSVRELLEFSKGDMCRILLSHKRHAYVFNSPVRIQKILKLVDTQLFAGLIEKHGQSQCLDDAVECLWSYVQQCLIPEGTNMDWKKPLGIYVRALHSLQAALNQGDDLYTVWHASLVLIVYEVRRNHFNQSSSDLSLQLFNESEHRAWIFHSCGAMMVMRSLGTQKMTSEPYKRLLSAQSAAMVCLNSF